MSTLSIAAYFPFRRVRITRQSVAAQADLAMIDVVPDERFRPVCHACGKPAGRARQREVRVVRDLNFGPASVYLRCTYRKVWCGGPSTSVPRSSGSFSGRIGLR
jgi:hypothetical protein